MKTNPNSNSKIVHHNLKGKEKLEYLYDSGYNKENRIELINPKDLDKENQKFSILEDGAFKCLIFNEGRKKYSAKMLSYLIDVSYKELCKRLTFDKNTLDKAKRLDKNQSVDYVAYIDDTFINIECNNSNDEKYMKRNSLYAFNIANRKNKESADDKEATRIQVIQVNLNNFAKNGEKRIIVRSAVRPKEGLVRLDNVIFIDIYLPNLVNKWYTKGIKKLTYLERLLLVYTLYDIKKCRELGGDDKFMNEFIDDAIEASDDNYMINSYNREAARIDHYKEIAFDKGTEYGIEQDKIDTAKRLHDANASMDIIKTATGFTDKQIKNICM